MKKLIKGDCIEVLDDLIRDGVKVDAVITDPPYQYLNHKLDIPFNEKLFFEKIKTVLKDNSFLVFFGRGVPLARWMCICEDLGFKFREELVYAKNKSGNFLHLLPRNHELAMVFSKGKINLNKVFIARDETFNDNYDKKAVEDISLIISGLSKIKNYKDFLAWKNQAYTKKRKVRHDITADGSSVKSKDRSYECYQAYIKGFRLNSLMKCKRDIRMEHPTQKPIDLMSKIVKLVSKESDTVLDPFMGSASTGVACFQNKRKFIGIEKDKEYYELAVDRMNGNFKKQKTFFPE